MGADVERNRSTFEKHYLLRIHVKPVLWQVLVISHYRVILNGRWERVSPIRNHFLAPCGLE
ncbi:hypothetical protein A8926_6479 [Saccharopolyspora spinosa]|uniref:Uncharacterized protein n=1 Tax=Saccharopolyspora spinosa TaxID=60894 RepID=A0A2N3Y656_SACSN|nr:hypothetical protein A8926_6479 [Saccharopolyspora spinosa]